MSHSHSQIMALPIIPTTVISRFESMRERWIATGRCSLCEIRSEEILIDESSHFFSIVPFAASSPFEIWIVPSNHDSHFHEIDQEKVIISSRSNFQTDRETRCLSRMCTGDRLWWLVNTDSAKIIKAAE